MFLFRHDHTDIYLSRIQGHLSTLLLSASAGFIPEGEETNLLVAVFEGHIGGKSNCIGLPPNTNSIPGKPC